MGTVEHRVVALLTGLVLVAGTCAGVDLVSAGSQSELRFVTQCTGDQECSYQDQRGSNQYVVKNGRLTRFENGAKIRRVDLAGKFENVLCSAISPDRRQIVVAIERAAMSRRSRRIGVGGAAGMMGSALGGSDPLGSPPPSMEGAEGADVDGLQRQYRCEIINPKSCETDKMIDLGPFWVKGLALSEGGEYLIAFGQDLQVGQSQVRVYNTRAGKMEVSRALPENPDVRLASNGFVVNGEAWKLQASLSVGGARRFVTKRFGSIAEYDVKCAVTLDPAQFEGEALAVIEIADADYMTNQMLSNSLTVKLMGAGFEVIERQKIEAILKELSLQGSGLTAEDKAVDIGNLASAHYLVFGALQQAGTTSTLTVRVVGVEDARIHGAAEVVCHDCEMDDYHEALTYLVTSWVGE